MTITFELPPASALKLQTQAAANGKDVETYVREAIEANLAVSGLSFREILEPVHREVEESGATEDELDLVADQVVAATRAQKSASRSLK